MPTAENRTPSAEIRTWPELEAALAQAGMWNDLAAGLTADLDVDGVLDALGWIAAVRADRRVRNHGAVLVKHLQAGRQAPVDWRPLAVCAGCGVVDAQCTCGVRERIVPAVYYTAAIEPLDAWGRDRWGVCLTCGRVDCTGHDPVGEGDVEEEVLHATAPNGTDPNGALRPEPGNGQESRMRGAWQGVAHYIKQRYGVDINLAEIGKHEVKVTFAGDERRTIVNVTQSMLSRDLKDFVEVIDAGPA